jgi:hypothetical protein
VNDNINMDSTIAGSVNDNINMDSTIAGSVNDNINMDSTIAGSVNDNINIVLSVHFRYTYSDYPFGIFKLFCIR